MAKDEVRETVIIFNDESETANVSTANRKWVNRMRRLVAEGHAEEVEASMEGTHEFEFAKSMLRMPFYRPARTFTEEQLEASRERLAAVREAVKGSKVKAAKKATKPVAKSTSKPALAEVPAKMKLQPTGPKTVKVAASPMKDLVSPLAAKSKKPAKPVVIEEEDEDDFDDDEGDDEEEVIVKRPAKHKK